MSFSRGEINTKTTININGVSYDLEVYQMAEGIITGFKFNGRIFLDVETVKETIDLFCQMSKPEFWNGKKDLTIKEGRKETVEEETERKKMRREIRLESRQKQNLEMLSELEKKNEEKKIEIVPEEKSDPVLKKTPPNRAPDNTSRFSTWLEKIGEKIFDIDDFTRDCPDIPAERTMEIISYQVKTNKLIQMGPTKYKTQEEIKPVPIKRMDIGKPIRKYPGTAYQIILDDIYKTLPETLQIHTVIAEVKKWYENHPDAKKPSTFSNNTGYTYLNHMVKHTMIEKTGRDFYRKITMPAEPVPKTIPQDKKDTAVQKQDTEMKIKPSTEIVLRWIAIHGKPRQCISVDDIMKNPLKNHTLTENEILEGFVELIKLNRILQSGKKEIRLP